MATPSQIKDIRHEIERLRTDLKMNARKRTHGLNNDDVTSALNRIVLLLDVVVSHIPVEPETPPKRLVL